MLFCIYLIKGEDHQIMKKIVLLLLVLLVATTLVAQTTGSGSVKLTAAYGSGIEAKLDTAYQLKIPMLVQDGPLFSGNNLKLKANLGVSPIAGTFTFDAVLTPIAVAEISLGGSIGTGWDFNFLGLELEGLKLGSPLTSNKLEGFYYMGRLGAAFQFDTGAVFSGDWMSVVIRTYHELNYKAYSEAGADVAWEFENAGSMVNGFNYKGEYIVGYQMPLMVNFVGAQLETYAYNLLDGPTGLFYDVGALVNTQITNQFSVLAVVQFTNYKMDDDRVIKKQDFDFKRVAVIASYAF